MVSWQVLSTHTEHYVNTGLYPRKGLLTHIGEWTHTGFNKYTSNMLIFVIAQVSICVVLELELAFVRKEASYKRAS